MSKTQKEKIQKVKVGTLFTGSDLRKLIVPLVLEQALAISVGMVDTMMVSSVGEAAVSGVSLVDMVNALLFNIMAALATGGAVVASQYVGAGMRKESCESAKQLVVASIGFASIIMLLVILGRQPLLLLLFGKIEADVMEGALIYLTITALSFPFLALYNACAALFRSMRNSKVTFKVSVLINLINVVGNAICVLWLRMGVAGVAIPTLISRAVGAIILYILLKNPKHLIYLDRAKYVYQGRMIKKILQIGIPSGIENGIFQLGRVLVVSIVSGMGTVQIAANGVANGLASFGVLIPVAVNLAMISVIGQCVGAGDMQQVRFYTKKLLTIAYLGGAVINILILVGLPWILLLYGVSEETKTVITSLIWLHNGMGIFLWPASFTLPNMLRACNDVKFTMVVSICSMFVLRIGFSNILGVHFEMGIIGVWAAMILDWICRISFFVPRYLRGKWEKRCRII